MFEGIVSDLLVKYLGQYLKDFNKENLRIGIWNGDVVLENLEIKEDALNQLNVPFGIKKGFLGKLRLKVPWKNLKSQPVIVVVENVYLVAQPDYGFSEYDEKKEREKELSMKKDRLAQAETMKSFNETDEEDEKSNSFVQRLVTKIVDNLQVEVNKVHVRFEDFTTNKEFPFAFGVCLDGVKLKSTNESWKEMFVENRVDKLIYKLAQMSDLSIYFDHITSNTISKMSTPDFMKAMASMISKKGEKNDHHFVLNPISASLKMIVNTSDVPDKNSKLNATLELDDISLELEDIQFQSIIKLSDSIANYAKARQYLKFRPRLAIKEKGGARQWWGYAIQSVLTDVKVKLHSRSWKFLLQRRKDRKEYVDLYKRKIGEKAKWIKALSKPELTVLEQYQERLEFNDIIFYRSLAEAELKKEAKNYKEAQVLKKQENAKKGFFTRVFGSTTGSSTNAAAVLDDKQREELYRTIDFKEVLEKIDYPRDYVRVRAGIVLKSTSFALIHNEKGTRTPLVYALMTALKSEILARTDSVKVIL